MYYDEPEPIERAKPKTPAGHYWLQGYADAFNGRQAMPPRQKKAAETYARGYEEGRRQREEVVAAR